LSHHEDHEGENVSRKGAKALIGKTCKLFSGLTYSLILYS